MGRKLRKLEVGQTHIEIGVTEASRKYRSEIYETVHQPIPRTG